MPYGVEFNASWSPRVCNAVEIVQEETDELAWVRMGGLEIDDAKVVISGPTEKAIAWQVGYIQTVCNSSLIFHYAGARSTVKVTDRFNLPLCDSGVGCGYWVNPPVKCLPFLDSLSDPGFKVKPGPYRDYPKRRVPWDYDEEHTLVRIEGFTNFSLWLAAFRVPLAKPELLKRYDWRVNWACTREPGTKELTWGVGWGVWAGHTGVTNVAEPKLTGVSANAHVNPMQIETSSL
jgi:hypothetical protein